MSSAPTVTSQKRKSYARNILLHWFYWEKVLGSLALLINFFQLASFQVKKKVVQIGV